MALPPPPPRLLLLLCLLLTLIRAENSTAGDLGAVTADQNVSVTPATPEMQNMTVAECLIDNQMGLIAIGSAGGLIVCLLVAVITLACQVYHLQRRVYIPRSSRSNLDLSGSAGYWANAAAAVERQGGVVGPCDASVMMDEMKNREEERETEDLGEIREEEEEDEEEEEEEGGAAGVGLSPEEKPLMQSSESRESCSDLPRDLEDMPLVV